MLLVFRSGQKLPCKYFILLGQPGDVYLQWHPTTNSTALVSGMLRSFFPMASYLRYWLLSVCMLYRKDQQQSCCLAKYYSVVVNLNSTIRILNCGEFVFLISFSKIEILTELSINLLTPIRPGVTRTFYFQSLLLLEIPICEKCYKDMIYLNLKYIIIHHKWYMYFFYV